MHDIKAIREDAAAYDANWARRGLEPQTPAILQADEEWRSVTGKLQDLQAQRNALSAKVGEVKRSGGNADDIMAQVAGIKDEMTALEERERDLKASLDMTLLSIPNLLSEEAPDGASEDDNKVLRTWGTVTKEKGDDHVAIGEKLGLIDFDAAAKLSGARFVVLKGALARLERALGQFMLDVHTGDHGYTEVSPPTLVNADALVGTSQLPKFEADLFKTDTGHYLIPTAEVPLTNLVRESIVDEETLPLRFTAYTPCFRSEAGSAGRDTRGMLRQHQFYKVEMVSITTPDQSAEEHERMTQCAETILQKLNIPYRVLDLCTGDIGFGSKRTYDLEAWLPGQEKYREISSCSTCGDFQARRMNTRCRKAGDKNTRFVHTLNGSGIAVGRALIAVMENYWDGEKITVPEVLLPYMGGVTEIK
jgi:seryl-tRNA synthetase